MDALDLSAIAGAHRLVQSLRNRGYIETLPHHARSISVIIWPEKGLSCAHCGGWIPVGEIAEKLEEKTVDRFSASVEHATKEASRYDAPTS